MGWLWDHLRLCYSDDSYLKDPNAGILYKDLAIDGLYKVEPIEPDDEDYDDDEE